MVIGSGCLAIDYIPRYRRYVCKWPYTFSIASIRFRTTQDECPDGMTICPPRDRRNASCCFLRIDLVTFYSKCPLPATQRSALDGLKPAHLYSPQSPSQFYCSSSGLGNPRTCLSRQSWCKHDTCSEVCRGSFKSFDPGLYQPRVQQESCGDPHRMNCQAGTDLCSI